MKMPVYILWNSCIMGSSWSRQDGNDLEAFCGRQKAGKDVKQLTSGNEFFQYRIMLRPDEVKDFVRAASKCDFDIDISYNRYVVDAKSIPRRARPGSQKDPDGSLHGYSEEFDGYVRRFPSSRLTGRQRNRTRYCSAEGLNSNTGRSGVQAPGRFSLVWRRMKW